MKTNVLLSYLIIRIVVMVYVLFYFIFVLMYEYLIISVSFFCQYIDVFYDYI